MHSLKPTGQMKTQRSEMTMRKRKKMKKSEIYMVMMGEVYYAGEYNGLMCFSTNIEKAYQFWNRESAEKRAKECYGRVIKFMEVE